MNCFATILDPARPRSSHAADGQAGVDCRNLLALDHVDDCLQEPEQKVLSLWALVRVTRCRFTELKAFSAFGLASVRRSSFSAAGSRTRQWW